MLLRFRFSNFQSFRAQQEFSLVASLGPDSTEDLLPIPPLKDKAVRTAAIYGANASGKTTVLRALQFMAYTVRDSHRLWKPDSPVPVRPFRDGAEVRPAPSEFEADFLLKDVRHQYAFSLDAEGVVQESLSVYPSGRRQRWFTRERGKTISFSRNLPGDNNKIIAGLTRKNSLFLSAAAQNAHDALSPVYDWFVNRLFFVIDDRSFLTGRTAHICMNDEYRSAIAEMVSIADLGITDVKLQLSELDESAREKTKKFIDALTSIFDIEGSPPDLSEPVPSFRLLHRIAGSVVPFDLEEESNGTIAYLALLGPITKVLKEGGALFIDELDRSLHPIIVRYILKLFKDRVTNPRGGQLIFNTHDTSMLSSHLLRRDQVWFTEKDHNGESHLYPLTDFKPRKQENLGSGYLQGRYGAIPFMKSDASIGDWDFDAEER